MEEGEEFHYYYKNPLATLKLHRGGAKRFSIGASRPSTPRYMRICRRIPAILLTLIVILATLGLIFASLVLRARSPRFELRKVKVIKSTIHNNYSNFSFANTTLVMDVAIGNKNFGRFEVQNGTISLFYGGGLVAEAVIKTGRRVRARGTARMNITMNLTTDELSDCLKKNLTSDVNSGLLKLRSYGLLRGRVYFMKIVNTSKVSAMDCSIWIDVPKNRIQNLAC